MSDVNAYIGLSAVLFTIGTIGVLTRRNAIVVFMCVELMLNACNLALVAFARQPVATTAVAGSVRRRSRPPRSSSAWRSS